MRLAGVPDAEIPDSLKRVESSVTDRGPGVHPLTGPIYVEGAEPGDTIEVRMIGFEFLHPYGVTGFHMFPGSPTLAPETYGAVVRDILSSLHIQGFRRFFVANGHSGNKPDAALEWAEAREDAAVIWHEVWDGRPDELAAAIDEDYDHASWSENFPWTRLEGVPSPAGRKPPFTRPAVNTDEAWREALGDGSFGGPYQLPDEDVLRVWRAAVEVLRERLESGWA